MCKICSKLTITTPERRRCDDASSIDEHADASSIETVQLILVQLQSPAEILILILLQEMFVLAINSLPQKLNKNISEMTKTDISMVDKTDAKKIQFLKLWEAIFNSMFTPVTIPFKKRK